MQRIDEYDSTGSASVQWVFSRLSRNPATMGDEDECPDVGAFASVF